MKKFFIISLILLFPCIVKSQTYAEAISMSESYMSRANYVDHYDRYILSIGELLDKNTYQIVLNNKSNEKSYLYDGNKYWSSTEANNQVYVIPTIDVTYPKTDNSPSVMVVETVKNNITVLGTGSKDSPWIFNPVNSITIISDKENAFSKTSNGTYSNELKYVFYSNEVGEAFINEDYEFISSNCGAYINLRNGKLEISRSLRDATCTIELEEEIVNITTVFDTPGSAEYKVRKAGYYKLEVWGAAGGDANGTKGGYGGYSVGNINVCSTCTIKPGDIIHVNVGGRGADGVYQGVYSDGPNVLAGGYNGGGTSSNWPSSNYESWYIGSGGGATHIATRSGVLSTLSGNTNSVLIVAGGGGGASRTNGFCSDASSTGASAGGYQGSNSNCQKVERTYDETWSSSSCWNGYTCTNYGVGGTQVSAGCENGTTSGCGGFGFGGSYNEVSERGGGGGGYYGGGSGRTGVWNSGKPMAAGGGGGSGYIGNPLLSSKSMYCYNCTANSDVATKTISTTNASETPTANYAKIGNGYAKITYIGN